MLNTDDVVRVREVAKSWNVGCRWGKVGGIFFKLLHSDPFAKHWYYDDEGYKLCTLKYPIVESFRKRGLQEAQMVTTPHDLCSSDVSLLADEQIRDLFTNQRYAECHFINTMSNGSMSPDLSEMWRQGYPVSPQWEGELELDSASDYDNENNEVDVSVTYDNATERSPKDNVSAARESSLWILIRDSICLPDVLCLRAAGKGWNDAKLYDELAALWFFLMTNKEDTSAAVPLPEWPSLCFDYRQNFWVCSRHCAEEGFVRRPHLLVGGVHSVPTNLVAVKEQQELREIKDEQGEEEVDGMESSKSKSDAHYMHG